MKLTQVQIGLMKHTIRNNNPNWFGTSFGCPDSVAFEELVKIGLATKEKPPSWLGDEVFYRLTKAGKAIADGALSGIDIITETLKSFEYEYVEDDEYYWAINNSKIPAIICGKCKGTRFQIAYRNYECIAVCSCGHRIIVYTGNE